MHQYARASLFQPSDAGHGDVDRRVSLVDLVEFARRWRRTILGVTGFFFAVAATYAFTTQPLFTAFAQVMLEPSQARDMLDDPNRVVLPVDQARVESHIEIIKSDQLALDVIRKLQLTKLSEFNAPKGVRDRDAYAVLVFERNLSARRVGQSLVIEIAFRFRDPALAAAIANGLVDAYIAREMQVKSDVVESADRWLYEKQAAFDKQTQAASAELEQYKAQPEDTPDRAAKIAELQTKAQIYQRMHDAFLQKFNEAIQKVAFPQPDVRFIAPASVPLQKSFPKRGLIVGLAILLGLGIGVIVALVRQSLDRNVRSPAQLTGVADCFGVVSELQAPPVDLRRSDRGPHFPGRKSLGKNPALRFAAEYPSSTLTKELRRTKVALDCAMDGQKSRLIGVVSARQQEGATTVAANLAAIYAASGLRTLIVDACPENPTLIREFIDRPEGARAPGDVHKPFQMGEQGVGTWLSVSRASQVAGLARIGSHGSGRHSDDFEALRDGYEAVIVDLPGLERSADAPAIARFLDAMIVVAQVESTPLEAVQSAVETLSAARASVIGVVLNRMPRPRSPASRRAARLAAMRGV